MRNAETRHIDGVKYTCRQMPATKGVRVFKQLVSISGTTLARAIAAGLSKAGGGTVTSLTELLVALKKSGVQWPELLETVSNTLLANLEHANVERILMDLMDGMEAKGGDGLSSTRPVGGEFFDEYFSGKLLHMLKVARFSIEVNFRDFFDALGSLTGEPEGQDEARSA